MRSLKKEICPPWRLAGCAPGTPVLAGLSGGADSVALTHLLARCAARDGFPLTALHVHHGIRGAEADRDAAFCAAFAKALGVELITVRVDVPALAEASGDGLETTARDARYRVFEAVMRERGIPLLATAHHADDNAETVLFRLCRGTGLRGLCGIPACRQLGDGWVTRPLLPFTKEELLSYCRTENLDFITDSSNLTPCCSRNILRAEVLPALERAVPGAARTVARTAETLRQDADCLDGLAEGWERAHRADGSLRLDGFSELHPALRPRALEAFLGGLETVHLDALERQILSGRGGCVALPGDRFASVMAGTLTVFPHLRGAGLTAPRPFTEEDFSLCDGKLTVSVRHTEKCRKSKKVHELSTTLYINQTEKSVIINQLFWRGLRPDDRMTVNGRAVRCAKLLQACGIPATVREKLPVLCGGEGEILWLPFAAPAEKPCATGYAVTVTLRKTGTETD